MNRTDANGALRMEVIIVFGMDSNQLLLGGIGGVDTIPEPKTSVNKTSYIA